MIFSSPVFLFGFLPLVLLFVAIGPAQKIVLWRNVVLTCASFIFYAWGETWLVLPLFVVAWVNYALAKVIEKELQTHKRKAFSLMLGGIIFNLSLLIVCKYGIWLLNGGLDLLYQVSILSNPKIIKSFDLPLGISFFTFQAMSYLIDVYRGGVSAAKTYISFSCYLTMFSQLVAGPIVRYADVSQDIQHNRMSFDNFYLGVQRFVLGVGKKVLIANQVAIIADTIFDLDPSTEIGLLTAWVGIIAYAMQIYYDFSAYSDMAIGIGHMFGFTFPENFRHPYGALSVKEFWRRWHISLSTWFRDYVYIPLGGNRFSTTRTYCNLITIFALCGLWHGASINFLMWGLWNGLFLVFERTALGKAVVSLPKPLRLGYVWLVFLAGWVFFRSPDMSYAWGYYAAMLGLNEPSSAFPLAMLMGNQWLMGVFVLAIIGSLGWPARVFGALRTYCYKNVDQGSGLAVSFEWLSAGLGAAFLFFSSMLLLAGTYNPFIYFRF